MREFTDPELAGNAVFPGETAVVIPEPGKGNAFVIYRTTDGTRLVGWPAYYIENPDKSTLNRKYPSPLQSETGYEDRM